MYTKMKCKKCRTPIFDDNVAHDSTFLNSHGSSSSSSLSGSSAVDDNDATGDCCILDGTVIYLNEDHLPGWIRKRVEDEKWSRGRINCKSCDFRIGAFDFVSGLKCDCANFVLPPVHIIKSKVDFVAIKT